MYNLKLKKSKSIISIFLILLVLLSISLKAENSPNQTVYKFKSGEIINSALIQKMIKTISDKNKPALLQFEKGTEYYLDVPPEGPWIINLINLKNITIDGQGSTFYLPPRTAFINMKNCRNIRIKNLNVDYSPLPSAEALVINKNPEERYIDIKVLDEFKIPPLGGPTKEKGEQAYFGMLWKTDPAKQSKNNITSKHIWIKDTKEAYAHSFKKRIIRVIPADDFTDKSFKFIEPNKTHISLPVRNIAHFGGHEVFQIDYNTNVYLSNIELWSAPWFGFGIRGNRGEVILKKVNIRPKPGTSRITSIWRDGFHVTANYAKLLWEDCIVLGNNDDDFNIKTFVSRFIKKKSPTIIQIKQKFPLNIVPYYPGDIISAFDVKAGKQLTSTRVIKCDGKAETIRNVKGRIAAPILTLTLDKSISGLNKDCIIWNVSSANPDTTIQRCQLNKSCRFRCSLTIENSELNCFSWFYGGENVEGPYPLNITIKNSTLHWGRGEGHKNSVSIKGPAFTGAGNTKYPVTQQVINNIFLENNTFYGNLHIAHAKKTTLKNNEFLKKGKSITLENSRNIKLQNNKIRNKKLSSPKQINIKDDKTRESIKIE